MHDIYRQDTGGHPTFALVFSTAELLKKHDVEFNALTCVNPANADHGLKAYRFLRDEIGTDIAAIQVNKESLRITRAGVNSCLFRVEYNL